MCNNKDSHVTWCIFCKKLKIKNASIHNKLLSYCSFTTLYCQLYAKRIYLLHCVVSHPWGVLWRILFWVNTTSYTTRHDTIGEFNVDWKAEYSALSSTRSQKKKPKQTTPVPPPYCTVHVNNELVDERRVWSRGTFSARQLTNHTFGIKLSVFDYFGTLNTDVFIFDVFCLVFGVSTYSIVYAG